MIMDYQIEFILKKAMKHCLAANQILMGYLMPKFDSLVNV